MDKEFEIIREEDYQETMDREVSPYLIRSRKTGTLATDGAEIYYETYVNPEEKASIVISHGFCEFCGKYEEVIYYFLKQGYSVFIMEHRGHGRSSRMVEDLSKIYIETYNDYVKDFHRFVTDIVQRESKTGILVLFAHSMGGAIGALMLEHYPKLFTCAILSSPMLEVDIGRYSNRAAWLLFSIASMNRRTKKFAPGERGFQQEPQFEKSCAMSKPRYMRVFEERKKDTRFQTSGATYAWVAASLKAVRILQKNAYRVKIPVLLFQAENDTTVKPGGQNLFAQNSKQTTLVVAKGAKHEIFNGTDEIIADYYPRIFSFIEEHRRHDEEK